jgi:6-phosphofructokinase 1
MGFPIQAIHVPKTVDNDLPVTDSCPGFGSVAKYVAVATREASFDVASMCKTSTKVFILEVMGRHAGWIAAAGGMAADKNNDIPLVILFPEVPFDRAAFVRAVDEKVKQHGYVSVVVSEGAQDDQGRFLSDQGVTDAFGHAQLGGAAPVIADLVKQELGYKYHWAVADYLQRAARHIASRTDVQHAYAVGKEAVKMALAGDNAVMPAIKRISSKPYKWRIEKAALSKVAIVEKKMPRDFITPDGFGITRKCRDYLAPLIKGEDYPPYRNGLPDYVRPKNVQVAKKLKPFEM